MPATLRVSNVVRINLNAGWQLDRTANRNYFTYGAGFDWRTPDNVWTLTGEVFGQAGAAEEPGVVAAALSARAALPAGRSVQHRSDLWPQSHGRARQLDHARDDRALQDAGKITRRSAPQDAAQRAAHDRAPDRAAHLAAERLAEIGRDLAGDSAGHAAGDLAGDESGRASIACRAAGWCRRCRRESADPAQDPAAAGAFALRRAGRARMRGVTDALLQLLVGRFASRP